MAALTNYLENKLIDHVFRGRTFTAPTVLAVGLFTSDPTDTGAAGTEVTGGSYARASLNPADTNWEGTHGLANAAASSGTGGATQNAAEITFPSPTADWGVITHWVLFDAATSGNPLLRGALTAPKTVNNGDAAPKFPIGAFDFNFD